MLIRPCISHQFIACNLLFPYVYYSVIDYCIPASRELMSAITQMNLHFNAILFCITSSAFQCNCVKFHKRSL